MTRFALRAMMEGVHDTAPGLSPDGPESCAASSSRGSIIVLSANPPSSTFPGRGTSRGKRSTIASSIAPFIHARFNLRGRRVPGCMQLCIRRARYSISCSISPEGLRTSLGVALEQHHEIIDAIAGKDARRAETVARQHARLGRRIWKSRCGTRCLERRSQKWTSAAPAAFRSSHPRFRALADILGWLRHAGFTLITGPRRFREGTRTWPLSRNPDARSRADTY